VVAAAVAEEGEADGAFLDAGAREFGDAGGVGQVALEQLLPVLVEPDVALVVGGREVHEVAVELFDERGVGFD